MATVKEKPRKLDEDGVYAAVVYAAMHYIKGDWIVFVRWYGFDASKKNDSGDRFYKKGVVPVDSLWLNSKGSEV